ncbi:MAG: FxLYD domain-containing protein [Chloroflexota bacterium]
MRRWLLLAALSLLCLTQCRSVDKPAIDTAATPTMTVTPEVGVAFVTVAPPTAVFVQTTPSPLPTATATPSPTPIVYTIASGDTLLALALQQGVTVDEIEALNPGIVPELLQIGQQVVLPPPATPLAQQSLGTPIPLQVVVTQVHAYQTPVGSLWLVGEVFNQSEFAAESVQVEISLLDEAGAVLATAVSWTAAPIIPAQTRVPFGVLIAEPPVAFAYPTVAVIGGATVTDWGTRYADLLVTETAVAGDGDRVQISGQVTNRGTETATNLLLIATLYNAQEDVSGYAQLQLDTTLAPGENTPFVFDATPPGGQVVTTQIIAQGQIP